MLTINLLRGESKPILCHFRPFHGYRKQRNEPSRKRFLSLTKHKFSCNCTSSKVNYIPSSSLTNIVTKTRIRTEWIWTTLVVLAIAALVQWLARNNKNENKNTKLPPGPKGIPILGHLHLLGKRPHQDLDKLSKKHGPIMYMQLGVVPTIIVSSPRAAERFLKTYDHVFAGRPSFEGSKYMSYEQRNFIFATYGPYWRNMRKLCKLELFSNNKIDSYQPMRKEELDHLVEMLKRLARDGVVVDLTAKISSLTGDMTFRMLFGEKYSDEELDRNQRGFRSVLKEALELAATPNIGDFFPYIGLLDIQGLTRRFKAISKVLDAFLEKIIDEHEQLRKSDQIKDFVDTMLDIMKSGEAEFEFDRRNIKAVMLDILGASIDSSATAIDWTMTELLRNPLILKKVQTELEEVVGMNKLVEESDLDRLEYLDMVVKESLRLHPVAPLLLPHEAMADCTVDGFHIPNKSRIFVNTWTIGRDPNIWSDPEDFIPERFIGSNIDVRGSNFQLIPFGSGRRRCPGMQLGYIIVRLVIAQLVHCFDWKLPYDMMPTDIDMTEGFGFLVSRSKNLMAIPSYRLHI